MRHWCCMCHTGEERRAFDHLAAQGYDPWAPMHAGEPLLKGYLFLQYASEPLNARYTPGVLRLLPFSDRPMPIPSDQIQVMREVERAAEEMHRAKPQNTGPEPTIAGMARTMLANILRDAGFGVIVKPDRVVEIAHSAADPREGGRFRRKRGQRLAVGWR